MEQNVKVNFCMSEKMKKNLDEICRLMGMDLTTMLMICCRKIEQDHRIPFEVTAHPNRPRPENNGRYSIGKYDTLCGGVLPLD